MNLAEHVLQAGLAHPDRLALSVLGLGRADRWSHARLRRAVLGTATGLLQAGIRPGDRLLMRLGNTPAFPVTYLGAIAAGIVPVPTSAMLTAAETTRLARSVRPAAIVADPGVPLPDHPAPVIDDRRLAGFADLPPAEFAQGPPDRLAYIVFTSGTSGQPRAVCHAHRAILARQMMFQGWYGLTPQDRLLHAGAFNWTFTLGTGLMDPWTLGATALIPAEGVAPEQIPLLASRHGATLIAVAAWIVLEAAERLLDPVPVMGTTMLAIAAAGLAVNVAAFLILHGGDQRNLNMRGAALHVLGDLLGSVAAIVAAGVILWTGWTPIDPILSVLVALLILRSAWALVARSWHVLMEGTPEGLDIDRLSRELADAVPGVADVHHVHAWSLTPDRPLITFHASLAAGADHDEVLRRLRQELAHRFDIEHSTIQLERDPCQVEPCRGRTFA